MATAIQELVERQRQQLAAELDTVRSRFPLDHPYRHELESPLHEDACAHMAPGCPCPTDETNGGAA